MNTQTWKSKPLVHSINMHNDNSLPVYDFPTLIKGMKNKLAWETGELNAMVLLKSSEKQIILTALHEDTEIKSFQSNSSITFQILEGQLKFRTRKESIILEIGQLLTLHEKVKYSLTSIEETVFLLTIANENIYPEAN